MKALRGANGLAVISRLNPIIRGWSAYYRTVVSSQAFSRLDNYMWALTYKWAHFSHPKKSRKWVTARYFGRFNPSRRNRWVFGDRDSGVYLLKFAWTRIVRHQMVPGTASLDDPDLADYWARRRHRSSPPLDSISLRVLRAQRGRCPAGRGLLLHAEHEPTSLPEWERWLTVTRKAVRKHAIIAQPGKPGTPGDRVVVQLIHAHCQQRRTAVAVSVPARSLQPNDSIGPA